MRVLHVVTLVSPDGAFGGPVRVAANQAGALRARGHDVVVMAGERGYGDDRPTELGGAPLHLFRARQLVPGTGFSGLASPPMYSAVRRALAGTDVVHVHLARDLITLPAAWLARRAGVPYVLQPHGMVVGSGSPLAGPLDGLLTKRVLGGAGAVLYLTPEERTGLTSVAAGPIALHELANGVPAAADVVPIDPGGTKRPEVLFCARLQGRKRPVLFAQMARALLREGVDASFVLVGPDEGEGAAVAAEVDAVGDPARLRWEGPLEPSETLARMQQATIVALPSVDEPYPMSVLEAMSVGRAVTVTDSCGLAPAVQKYDCGVVVDDSLDGFVAAVRGLLADPAGTAAMGLRAAETARRHFAMESVAARLESIYTAVTAGHDPSITD